MNWLKNAKHRTLQGVVTDRRLTNEEKKILTGIHKRHLKMADRPSVGDYTILERSYGKLFFQRVMHEDTPTCRGTDYNHLAGLVYCACAVGHVLSAWTVYFADYILSLVE